MYHDLEPRPRPPRYDHFYVLASEFRRQLLDLLAAGYRPITLRNLADARWGLFVLPEKPFVVTFDDGYRNLMDYGRTVLQELAIPYTVFLISGKIGKISDWMITEGYNPSALLDWRDIQSLRTWPGADFQAHTVNHIRLADVPLPQAREELLRCKGDLEDRLRQPVDVICYPYGSVNDAVAGVSREIGYKMGLTTQFGRVRQDDDPMLLPRVAIHHVPSMSLKFGPRSMNFWWRIKSRKDTRADT